MKANLMKKTIEMSKAEAKAAGRVNTDEFMELAELRAACPGFRIVVKTTKSKDTLKGLTFDYMEKYIKSHDDEDGSIMMEFYTLRGLDENRNKIELTKPAAYAAMKKWFLSKYPEVEHTDKVNEILARAKANREAQKAVKKFA